MIIVSIICCSAHHNTHQCFLFRFFFSFAAHSLRAVPAKERSNSIVSSTTKIVCLLFHMLMAKMDISCLLHGCVVYYTYNIYCWCGGGSDGSNDDCRERATKKCDALMIMAFVRVHVLELEPVVHNSKQREERYLAEVMPQNNEQKLD